MKRKILLFLFTLFLFSALGAGFSTLYIRNTTATLNRLINLHEIEDLRQRLIRSIQTVQSDLYTVNTELGQKLDLIADNVTRLEEAAQKCSNCHHSAKMTKEIENVQAAVSEYQNRLSYYITASANKHMINKLKRDAAFAGNNLLEKTEEMSLQASSKLKTMTDDAMFRIKRAWIVLSIIMSLIFAAAIFITINLMSSITRPINNLVQATRSIASGNLGYTIALDDKTEFGELAAHFNSMSAALKSGYAKLEQEIRDRNQTETALIESEAFLNTIFNSIRDPFCIIDRSFRIVRANQAFADMKKKSLSELMASTCHEILYNKNDVCPDCIVQKTFRSGDSCADEKAITSGSGFQTWFEVYTYPILDHAGAVSHVVEYTRDVTARKRAENALRDSEQRYALAARGANDGLWDWDLRSNRIYYSYRWKSMLGYEETELSDHPEEWFSRVHPDDREEIETRIASHLDGRNPHFESEYRIMHRDGTFRWVLSRGLAVRDKSGQAIRMAGSQTDITARKKAEEQLLYDAFHDALTALPNRALFLDRLQHVIASSHRRKNYLYAVLFLDIDRFKVINDSLGHTFGDQLLIAVGRKLSDCLRPGDTVARLGGDEFAVLLDDISELKDAVEIAERIQSRLSTSLIIKGKEVFTSASIGIALSDRGYERPEQILRDADIAMYEAKAKGSASYEIFDSRMHANILDRLELEADLRRALEHHEFLIHYQPIVELNSKRLIGFEALIRWNHPKRGLVYPLEFIPLAEQNGLINIIGDWIMREACRQLSIWQREYPQSPPLTMSVNISGKQFSQPDLIDKLTAIVKETGIDAKSLALEITESMIMENIENAVKTMTRLRELGFNIQIDDFGTGYSSLNYLHRFPVTALKIDRAFVSKLTSNGENKEIIASIVSLANSLNLNVIAEGVELVHQLSRVRELQCRYGQGYFFSEPMESGAIDRWMREQNRPDKA